VAKAIAASINNSSLASLSDFSAVGDGAILMIVKRSGGAFTPAFSLTKVVHPATRDITAAAGATAVVTSSVALGGAAVAGETWRVGITIGAGPTFVTTFAAASASTTAADIAAIPIATDGKFRLHRCTVVAEKDVTTLVGSV
jgi:hypothetical protein